MLIMEIETEIKIRGEKKIKNKIDYYIFNLIELLNLLVC